MLIDDQIINYPEYIIIYVKGTIFCSFNNLLIIFVVFSICFIIDDGYFIGYRWDWFSYCRYG
jgi:hypothetical protein